VEVIEEDRMSENPKEDADKGVVEKMFGTTSVAGRRGLMFVGFIAPAGLGDLARLLSDSGQVESVLKRVRDEAARRDAEEGAGKRDSEAGAGHPVGAGGRK
jgi:hypothetical protein